MAETVVNNKADEEVMMVTHHEEEEAKVNGDFADCDECSSGSDRSCEADDVDSGVRGEPGTNGYQNSSENPRSRRRRRHGSHGSRRHKGGSRHKHKGYQPYPSKDSIEMQLKRKSLELQEKENAAAVVRREEADQQFITFPVAPFNSTQFLMDEHSANSPANLHKTSSGSVLISCSPPESRLNSVPSTPAESNHEIIGFEKKDKEFSDFFTTAHAESLQSLPKDELVKHYMNLEEKVAALQRKVAEQQQRQDSSCSKVAKQMLRVCVCDSIYNSDADLLRGSKDEFVDLNQSSIVEEEPMLESMTSPSSTSGEVVCAESAS